MRDLRLYRRALTAPTAVLDPVGGSFERLEYLGDAVLGVIAREYIYARWRSPPSCPEHQGPAGASCCSL